VNPVGVSFSKRRFYDPPHSSFLKYRKNPRIHLRTAGPGAIWARLAAVWPSTENTHDCY